jgi:hypothetical protein
MIFLQYTYSRLYRDGSAVFVIYYLLFSFVVCFIYIMLEYLLRLTPRLFSPSPFSFPLVFSLLLTPLLSFSPLLPTLLLSFTHSSSLLSFSPLLPTLLLSFSLLSSLLFSPSHFSLLLTPLLSSPFLSSAHIPTISSPNLLISSNTPYHTHPLVKTFDCFQAALHRISRITPYCTVIQYIITVRSHCHHSRLLSDPQMKKKNRSEKT